MKILINESVVFLQKDCFHWNSLLRNEGISFSSLLNFVDVHLKNKERRPGQSLQIVVKYRKWVENERFVQVLHRKRPFLRSIPA